MAIYVRNEQGNLKPLEIPALQGKDGLTPDIQIGEVTKLESDALPTVTRRGTKEEPIFDFGIPHVGVEDRDKLDYMGNPHETLKETNDANVEYVLGEVNTVHYEGQHITATDTFEKQVKSAILKGQTLVNLVTNQYEINPSWNTSKDCVTIREKEVTIKLDDNTQGISVRFTPLYLLKPNTKYMIIGDVISSTSNHASNYLASYVIQWYIDGNYKGGATGISNNKRYNIFTTGSEFNSIEIACYARGFVGEVKYDFPVLLEYVDGMENWDIPYFEGMQSVKMPVLTTTGKNLIGRYEKVVYRSGREQEGATLDNDGNFTYVGAPGNRPCLIYKNNPNTSVTVSANVSLHGLDIYEYSDIPNFTREDEPMMLTEYHYGGYQKSITRTTSKEAKYIGISFYNDSNNIGYTNLQLEYGLQATVHEPFKSNILSTSEDVILRGIGDMQDTLDLISGEVTERIGEIVLDGSENWSTYISNEDTISFIGSKVVDANDKQYDSTNLMSDKLIASGYGAWLKANNITLNTKNFSICLLKSSLETIDVNGFKKWLSENPIRVQYVKAQESIKTVDLKGQKVYSYKDTTHYDCSSSEGSLVPTLSIDVPTNLPALVSRQRSTIEEQKEQISTLEVNNKILSSQNEVQDEMIDITLMATDEMFMMLEPLLAEVYSLQGGDSKMVDMYVAMVQRGLKTIDQVPARYREQVQEILAQLEA